MATAVLSSEEEQSYNSDYSDAESEKAKTPKKSISALVYWDLISSANSDFV